MAPATRAFEHCPLWMNCCTDNRKGMAIEIVRHMDP
jgi:hypothetical protein